MLQATIDHREGFVPSNKQSCSISSATPTKNRKENIIQHRLATAEREIAFLQMQVHELRNAYVLLEKFLQLKTNSVSTKEQMIERFFTS